MTITSFQNPRIKNVCKLRRRRERDQQRKTLVEDYRAILRAVENGYPLDELYICPALFLGEHEDTLVQRAGVAGAQVIEVSEGPFRKMASQDRPEGLLAVASQVRARLHDHAPAENGFYVVVESIERPGNLGSIIRSADAAGADGVIVCDARTDVFNPEVIRASIGAIFAVPVLEASTADALAWCRTNGLRILAATPHADMIYTDADMVHPLAIAVGTEKYGLSETWLHHADAQVRIPMFGQADSLNVATATTLLLYEVVRQRREAHSAAGP